MGGWFGVRVIIYDNAIVFIKCHSVGCRGFEKFVGNAVAGGFFVLYYCTVLGY